MIRLKDLISKMEEEEGVIIRVREQGGKKVYKGCTRSIPAKYERGIIKHIFISCTGKHINIVISLPEPLTPSCEGCDNIGICETHCGYVNPCIGCTRESCMECKEADPYYDETERNYIPPDEY